MENKNKISPLSTVNERRRQAENRNQLADALRLSDELMYQHKSTQKNS